MSIRRIAAAFLGFLASVAVPALALAQRVKARAATGAPELKASLPLWSILCSIVVVAGICVVVFRRPARAQEE